MTDSTKTILYPSAALLALVLGTLLFGWWCGLTAVWSLAILGVVVGLAVVVAVPQVIHDELRESASGPSYSPVRVRSADTPTTQRTSTGSRRSSSVPADRGWGDTSPAPHAARRPRG